MIGQLVYVLCTLTSLLTAVILLKNFFQRRVRFLLWSGLCFVGLALGNILLFVDRILWPYSDLSLHRIVPAVLGYGVLLYGFIWDAYE